MDHCKWKTWGIQGRESGLERDDVRYLDRWEGGRGHGLRVLLTDRETNAFVSTRHNSYARERHLVGKGRRQVTKYVEWCLQLKR